MWCHINEHTTDQRRRASEFQKHDAWFNFFGIFSSLLNLHFDLYCGVHFVETFLKMLLKCFETKAIFFNHSEAHFNCIYTCFVTTFLTTY